MVVQACIFAVFVVDGTFGWVTREHAGSVGAVVAYGGALNFFAAVSFEAFIEARCSSRSTTFFAEFFGAFALGRAHAAAAGESEAFAAGAFGAVAALVVGLAFFGADTFGVFFVGEVDTDRSFHAAFAEVVATE